MDKSILKLDERLKLSASYVRYGSVAADIGTDHAYIPIYLISNGISKRVVASDINEGPLECARINCEKYKIINVDFFLSDGFENIDCNKFGITDVLICGMGGEMIAGIIDREDYLKNSSVRLILQPMTGALELRKFLSSNGFSIVDEALCKSSGKLYQVIVSEYSGTKNKITELEAIIGACILEKGRTLEHFEEFVRRQFNILKKRKDGKEQGGKETFYEKRVIDEIVKIAEKNGFSL